jgi:hypothetical protein
MEGTVFRKSKPGSLRGLTIVSNILDWTPIVLKRPSEAEGSPKQGVARRKKVYDAIQRLQLGEHTLSLDRGTFGTFGAEISSAILEAEIA